MLRLHIYIIQKELKEKTENINKRNISNSFINNKNRKTTNKKYIFMKSCFIRITEIKYPFVGRNKHPHPLYPIHNQISKLKEGK